jgi:hypothetical protein
MVITIVVDHPLDVPLGPAHLLFFLAFPFPFEPALHPKARAKVRGLALKGDLIDRLLLIVYRFFVLFYRCSQIGKVAQRLVPPLLGTVCSRLLPLLALLLSEAREGESALRPLLSFLLRHLLHRTPHRVALKCLLVLLPQDAYQFCHATTSIPCCDRRAAGTKRETLQLTFLFPTLFLSARVDRQRGIKEVPRPFSNGPLRTEWAHFYALGSPER